MNTTIAAFKSGKGKTLIILGLALMIGLLAAWAARSYLGQRVAEIEARAQVKTVGVVVAKSDIASGQILSSDNLAVRDIPAEWLQSAAVTPEQFDRVNGQTLAFNLRPGEMLMWPMLEQRRASTFSARVANGRRALTLPVDEINSISGMLEPEDRIDLLITIDQAGKKFTAPLMYQVRVLATGQRAEQGATDGERRMYSTVTLDIAPGEAENLILAREVGKVTALLRHPDDKAGEVGQTLNVQAFVEAPSTVGDASTKAVRDIPVLYGGKSEKYTAAEVDLPSTVHKDIQRAVRDAINDNAASAKPNQRQ